MEDVLSRQPTFDDVVATILARFASALGSEIDGCIQSSLAEISQFIGVDYAFVIRVSSDQATWSATHEWCAPGAQSHLAKYQQVPMGTFRWTERAILAGEIVRVNSLDDIPPEAADIRRHMESLGFKSTLQLPLKGRGRPINGCIALSSLRQEMTWTDADVQRLRLVGDSIANALNRKSLEEQLQASEARYRATFERAPVGIANVGVDGRIIEANQRLCDMLGFAREELLGRHFSELTHTPTTARTRKLCIRSC